MGWREAAKKRAAVEAVKHVKSGFMLGLGAGSTAAYAIKEIGRRMKKERLQVWGVPTSNQASMLATECGIPLTTLEEHPVLDLDIDGADQIDQDLNLIKGMGGALTREKIVASASKKMIIVADETKLVDILGENQLLPVEVLPFATAVVSSGIKALGGKPYLRQNKGGSEPYLTDNGNFILDVDFGAIGDPFSLGQRLKAVPGVIETGLFLGMASLVYVGTGSGVKALRKGS
jgi:ribose 5-phosphate isomerase A